MRDLMSKFEAKKKAFKGAASKTMHIDLPPSFIDIHIANKVKQRQITISKLVTQIELTIN